MIWFLVPIASIIIFAAAIDQKRKKANNHLHQSTHPDSHAVNSSSFASGDDYNGGND